MTRSSFVALALVVAAIVATTPDAALADPPQRLTLGVAATSVAAPPGCTAGAVGGGVIAWDCGDTRTETASAAVSRFVRHMVVTDVAGAVVGTTDVPYAYELSKTVAVGGQWVEHFQPDPNGKGGGIVRTNWQTGEQPVLGRDRDASVWPDLDRVDLFAAYSRSGDRGLGRLQRAAPASGPVSRAVGDRRHPGRRAPSAPPRPASLRPGAARHRTGLTDHSPRGGARSRLGRVAPAGHDHRAAAPAPRRPSAVRRRCWAGVDLVHHRAPVAGRSRRGDGAVRRPSSPLTGLALTPVH